MFHHPIEDADVPATDIARIGNDLAELAAGLDARFLNAGTALASAVEMIDRMLAGLDGVVATLDARTAGVAVADLDTVAARLIDLPRTRGERKAAMADVAAISRTLREQVMDIHRTLRVLSIYGMNIKIAASGNERFVSFVEGMNERLGSGEDLLADVLDRLKDLAGGLCGVQQVDRLLEGECTRVLPAVPQRLTADAAALAEHLNGVADLARRVAAIARNVQAKVAVLLGALQVGDSCRQRLEHVIATLQIVATYGAGPAAVGHVDRLLSAQLGAIAADFTRETRALVASLAGLVPDAHGLATLIAEQGDGGGRGVLTRLDQSVTGMDRVIYQVQRADGEARTMIALIADTVAGLTQRVGSLGRVRLDVQDIATNTRLLCRRHGETGKAVAVVAAEVDALTHQLGRTTDGVAETVAALGDAEGRLAGMMATERGIDETLRDALAVIRTACQRTEQVAMTGGDDARQLIGLIEATAEGLERELGIGAVIERAAAALADRAEALGGTPDAEEQAALERMLPDIARLYTMAAEREVHALFLLPGMTMASAAAGAGDEAQEEDDDDGLF
ncbi:MAG: hypothetical protein PGN09_04850 [Sphingomonas fennica]